MPLHYVTKHLQQGIESDHFWVKRAMPHVGSFRSFNTVRSTIQGFEPMLWLRKGFGFAGVWSVREQNQLLRFCFGLQPVNKTYNETDTASPAAYGSACDRPLPVRPYQAEGLGVPTGAGAWTGTI